MHNVILDNRSMAPTLHILTTESYYVLTTKIELMHYHITIEIIINSVVSN